MNNHELLSELIEYNKETGILTWKPRTREHFKNDVSHKIWNNRFPGKECGCVDKDGYRVVRIKGRMYYCHRLAWEIVYGVVPYMIDHIDSNRLNNKIENLRLCNLSQNNSNRGKSNNNTSGFKGVSFHKKTGKWRADISSNGNLMSLGVYKTAEEAFKAYCAAANKYHKEFANYGYEDV